MSEGFTSTLQEMVLGEHAHIRARIGWRGLSSKEYIDNGGALLGAGNHISNGRFDWSRCDRITLERYEESPEIALREKDVVISKDGTIGRVAYIDKLPQIATINGTMMLVRVHSGQLDPHFVYHYLQSERFQSLIQERVSGSSVPHIFQRDMVGLKMAIPSLPEQKKIAEILSGIDLRVRLGEQKIAHLEILLKSLGDKFFGNQSQYETKTIGEIFEVSSGTTPSRSRQDYFCTNGGTPWVKTMDLNDNHIRTTDEQLTTTGILEGRAKIFPAGTLLIAMYGGWNQIGRTGILANDSSCNQAMSALLPTEKVSPEFLNLQLVIRRSYWRGVAASSRKDPNITKADVTNMPIAIPALNEQHEITNALGSVLRQKSSEYQYLETLNLLKSALASDLLSGRKRVSV